MVIGGMLGSAAGVLFHRIAPHIVTQPAAFVLVGMAGFFAGAAKVPVSSLVMVSEMTGGYGLLVPLMLTNAIAFLFTPRNISIYEKQVDTRAQSGAHAGEFFFDVLARIKVAQYVPSRQKLITFTRGTPLADVIAQVTHADQAVFPVMNADGSLHGVFDMSDIGLLLGTQGLSPGLVVAEDLCFREFRVTTPDESLASALRKLRKTRLEALPVVENGNSRELQGIISRRDISNAYHDYLYREALS
jgi:CIC family chloride channel protein